MDNCVDMLPASLADLLNDEAKVTGLDFLISKILTSIRTIGTNMRNGDYSSETVGTQNAFGDHQLDVDIQTDLVIVTNLKESRKVKISSSEENPVETDLGGKGFSVAYDPLDGSSIVDANLSVGTIVGVFRGDTLLNVTGRDLAASMISMYGPRVTVALAIDSIYTKSNNKISLELTMKIDHWWVTVPQFSISPNGNTFAPGNLRATSDNIKYNELIKYWIDNKYTLRYSGGLVPDVYHILIKGQGVLANASSATCKAKLRLLYEAVPIAFLIEAAGGSSLVCPCELQEVIQPSSLLDVPVNDLDKRVGVCYGSKNEVERFKSYIFSF